MDIRKLSQNIQEETGKIIVGKSDRIRLIVMSILANGHILLDDLPGVGKTTLVKTISIALGCQSGRIQFVPDLLPSDIIGMRIYNQKTGDFELRQGPVMTNLLLADEINRAGSHGGAADLHRRRAVPSARPFPGAGYSEPGGVGEYLPAPCGPDGPLPYPHQHGLPNSEGGTADAP